MAISRTLKEERYTMRGRDGNGLSNKPCHARRALT
jgi:hypothetical protein